MALVARCSLRGRPDRAFYGGPPLLATLGYEGRCTLADREICQGAEQSSFQTEHKHAIHRAARS